MLKVGDKLLCKKGIGFNDKVFNFEVFNFGDYYTIQFVHKTNFFINNWWFEKSESGIGWHVFDYFYTPKEVRKMKLKQLRDA